MNWKSFIEGENSTKRVLMYIGGGAVSLLLTVIILINLLLIVSNVRNPNQMPSVFGIRPAIVLSGSMAPTFQAGDVILLEKTEDPEQLEVGDVACYLYSGKATTHRVIERFEAEGKPRYIMKGDYNNVEDRLAVDPEQIQGVWTGKRIPGLGKLLMFMQSTMGMFLLLICPLAGLLSWDIWKRRREDRIRQESWEGGASAAMDGMEPEGLLKRELRRVTELGRRGPEAVKRQRRESAVSTEPGSDGRYPQEERWTEESGEYGWEEGARGRRRESGEWGEEARGSHRESGEWGEEARGSRREACEWGEEARGSRRESGEWGEEARGSRREAGEWGEEARGSRRKAGECGWGENAGGSRREASERERPEVKGRERYESDERERSQERSRGGREAGGRGWSEEADRILGRHRRNGKAAEWADEFAYYSSQEDLDYYEELEAAAEHYRRMKESLTRFRRMEALMKRCRRLEEELVRYEELAKRLESYERRDAAPIVRKRPDRPES